MKPSFVLLFVPFLMGIAKLGASQISVDAQAIIDRYNLVTGGTESKQSIRSVIYEGTWEMLERELSGNARIYIQNTEIFGFFLEVPDVGTIKNCFAHGKAWVENPFTGTQGLEGSEFEQMGKSAIIFPETQIETFYRSAQIQEHLDPSRIKLLLEDKKGYQETWFFDASTGYLSEIQTIIDSGVQGSYLTRLLLSDYQPYGEILYPRTLIWHTPAYQVEIRIDSILVDAEIPEHLFQPPPEASDISIY